MISDISSMLVCIKVNQWCGKKIRVVLKVPDEELYWISNRAEKVFYWMGQGILVGGGIKNYFLPEFFQFKEHHFGAV